MTFSQIKYERVDLQALKAEIAALTVLVGALLLSTLAATLLGGAA